MEQSIESRVIKLIRELIGTGGVPYKGVIQLDMSLGKDKDVDIESVQGIELIAMVEEEFELELDEEAALEVRTVQGIVDLVKRTLAEQSPSAPKAWED